MLPKGSSDSTKVLYSVFLKYLFIYHLFILYAGYEPLIVMESCGRGTYLFIYESCKHYLSRTYIQTYHSQPSSNEVLTIKVIAGANAGIFSWLLVYPFDVIKARLQVDLSNKIYSNVFDCVVKTWAEGGVRAFTRGLGLTLLRAAPVASIILPIYETSKEYIEYVSSKQGRSLGARRVQ